ncbi:MAG: NAD-dependent protein deacetylase [Acidiferrobacterales bacterium]|nr:NAD-dependent protein deacetylase [Acidiferrobacterales bacterium]
MVDSNARLSALIDSKSSILVLTGAGISVDSGIPPYRDHTGTWLGSEPIQHQEFIDHESRRKRYWARSAVGWPAVAKAKPNDSHRVLASMERAGIISLLVTQNVDRLHQKAGHQKVIDLHGRLDQARCLSCENQVERSALQQEILSMNPFLADLEASLAPDGDATVENDLIDMVSVPHCQRCGGVLMPSVVFFGGAVPTSRVTAVTAALEQCDALLVIGTSLMVYSGFRFCRQAHAMGIPIIAINQGETRADAMLSARIIKDCKETLVAFAADIKIDF